MNRTSQITGLMAFTVAAGIFGAAQLPAQTYPGGLVIQPSPGPSSGAWNISGYPIQPFRDPTLVQPQYPVVLTDNTLAGFDQFGRPVTTNTQIDNTAFDHGRLASQFNGSRRRVDRPVRNQFGQIVGYEQGWVWTNSITGQEHGDTQVITHNGVTGGVHVQKHFRSPAPSSGQSIHVQNRQYGRNP